MADASAEFKKKFPGEKIKSISKARVKIAPGDGQTEKRISLASKAEVVVSKNLVALVFDPNTYYAVMSSLAFLSLFVAVVLLLGSQNLLTIAIVVLGFLCLLAAEGFLFMEMQRAAVTAFDRTSTEISFDAAARTLHIKGVPQGNEWLGEKKTLVAILNEGEKEPAL